jgi:hypothetical protein
VKTLWVAKLMDLSSAAEAATGSALWQRCNEGGHGRRHLTAMTIQTLNGVNEVRPRTLVTQESSEQQPRSNISSSITSSCSGSGSGDSKARSGSKKQ